MFSIICFSALFGSGFESDDDIPLLNPPPSAGSLPDSDGYYSHG